MISTAEHLWYRYLSISTTSSSCVKNWKHRNLYWGPTNRDIPWFCWTNFNRLEKLSDPDADPPGAEPGLLNLCDEIRTIVKQEASIIGDVFPHPSTVIQVFLQRIFQQSVYFSFLCPETYSSQIQNLLEGLTKLAEQNSSL